MTKEECDLKFEMLEIRSDIERCLNKHNIEASSKNISNMASVMLDQMNEGNICINADEAFNILYPNHNKEKNTLSVAAKVEIAMALLDEGYITTPEEYLEILNADSILQKTEEPDEEQVLVYEYFDKRKSVPVIEVQDHLNYVLNPREEKIHFANLRKGYQAPVCTHSWKPYMGFTKNYNYCEHCGVKENENSGD